MNDFTSKKTYYSTEVFGDPANFLSGVYEEKNYEIGMHMHDFFEICILMNGTSFHSTLDGTTLLKKGDIIIVPPGILHSFESLKGNESHIFNIMFHRNFFTKYHADLINIQGFLQLFMTKNSSITVVNSNINEEKPVENMLSAMAYITKNNCLNDKTLNPLGLALISEICNKYIISRKGILKNKENKILNKAIFFIETNIYNKITIDEIAKYLFISTSTLRRIFNSQINLSPNKYIENARMQKAIELLQSSTYNINQIAEKCGFYDSAHFCKIFKNNTKFSPKNYRKHYGKLNNKK